MNDTLTLQQCIDRLHELVAESTLITSTECKKINEHLDDIWMALSEPFEDHVNQKT